MLMSRADVLCRCPVPMARADAPYRCPVPMPRADVRGSLRFAQVPHNLGRAQDAAYDSCSESRLRPGSDMPIFELPDSISFPPAELADEDGLLAIGGDLMPERVLTAYANGIFPWPHDDAPLLWFSPDPRMVIRPAELRIPRRLARTIRQGRFEVTLDTVFEQVIAACSGVPRVDQGGTWITAEMVAAYTDLHRLGYAHSAEAWFEGQLVGGVYGISIGAMFCGESMFTIESDASKVALVTLIDQLARWGFDLFDAQLYMEHLVRYGFQEWPRNQYLEALSEAVRKKTRLGTWRIDTPA